MLRLSLLLFALLAAGCYDDAGVPAPKNDPLPEANLSLPDLSARCGDTPVRIVQDIVVAGRVTTSDEAGNFFRSVVLQEDGTGVELMAGLDDLFRVYPPGCRIAVRLQGLAMCRRFGVVQIGTMPAAGDYAVEAIGVRALLDRYVACETVDVLRPVPRIVAFDELAPDMCGCLVQIEDLTPLPSEEDPTDWNGKVIGCSRTGPETGSPPIRAPMPGMRLRKFRRGRLRWSAFCSTAMPGRSEILYD